MTATERIEKLSPRLTAIAKKYACSIPEIEWEDLYQMTVIAIIEKSAANPSFLEQTDAYICGFARFYAQHTYQKSRVYLRYVSPENPVKESDEDCLDTSSLDFAVWKQSDSAPVENAVVQSELYSMICERCGELSESNLQIVSMLFVGYKKSEIADLLGISRAAVTSRIKTIASQLSELREVLASA